MCESDNISVCVRHASPTSEYYTGAYTSYSMVCGVLLLVLQLF